MKRRGIVSEEHIMCDQIGKKSEREACHEDLAKSLGIDRKFKHQVSPPNDSPKYSNSREVQRSKRVDAAVEAPFPTLPLGDSEVPGATLKKLKLIQMFPDVNSSRFDDVVARYESVAAVGDMVIVADPAELYIALQSSDRRISSSTLAHGGFRYRVKGVLKPNMAAHEHAVDLQLEYAPNKHAGAPPVLTAAHTQAMGLGYIPRNPTRKIPEPQRKKMPVYDEETILDDGPGSIFQVGLDPKLIPRNLYVPTRTTACADGANWADRTFSNVQWLPVDLADYDNRLQQQQQHHHRRQKNPPT